MLTARGKIVDQKDTNKAIESAYAKLPDDERAELDELADVLTQRITQRGTGKRTARQILGAIGIYLVECPGLRAHFDTSGRLLTFTERYRSRPKPGIIRSL